MPKKKAKKKKPVVYGCAIETCDGGFDIRFRRKGFIIGEFCISDTESDSLWIEHISGEGMQTSKAKFADVVKKYYNDNF